MDFDKMIDEMRAERQSMLLEILELRERCKLLSDENESYSDEVDYLLEGLEGTRLDLTAAQDELEGARIALRGKNTLVDVMRASIKELEGKLYGENQAYQALNRLLDEVRKERDEQARLATLNHEAMVQYQGLYFGLRAGINAAMADK